MAMSSDPSGEGEADPDEFGDPGAEDGRARNGGKSDGAFRTISEVSTELEVPQHVLRFWETKFTQLRPLKRGGGRRYYRPEDVALLRRIHGLLYREGYTIKGVQRVLRAPRKAGQSAAPADSRADDSLPPAQGSAGAIETPPPGPAHQTAEALLSDLLFELKAMRSLLD
jgi:DNA-binding transcriptional MerR regulator